LTTFRSGCWKRIDPVDGRKPAETEGIIGQFNEGGYDLVVIGRREKSKSEEFVMGDVGVKLIRSLEGAAGILVVKSD